MKTLVQIGTIGLDGLHLGFLALGLGALVWLYVYSNRVKQERIGLDLQLKNLENAAEEAKTQRLRAVEAEKKVAAAGALEAKTKEQFESLAQDVLAKSQNQFMALANETFAKHKQGAKGDLEKLMEPIGETFAKFKARVDHLEKVRTEEGSALKQQVKAIGESLGEHQQATSKLVSALSTPRGGGNWGEESLRNVMEMAGMSEHADFTEQVNDQTARGRLRPDVVIRMPGGREIVVDSKVSMEDFLAASSATDAATRKAHLTQHARKLRDHVRKLSTKEYWKDFEDRVDFVAMYIPGEQFYTGALEVDRDLFEFAARNRVIIVTPSTLIALAKAVAYGWRQEDASKNALEAALIGRQLYESLVTMGTHIERTGKSLNGAVDNYNKMVGSLERNVFSKARKFQDLQIAQAGSKTLTKPEPIEEQIRLPARTGELDFEDSAA